MWAVSGYLSDWQRLVESGDLRAALKEHLSFLVDSPQSAERLTALLGNLTGARIAGQQLELVFRYTEYSGECVVGFDPPYDGDTSDAPASVTPVVRVHNGIGWESPGGGGFGFNGFDEGCFVGGGGWEAEALTEAAQENKVFLDQLSEAGLAVDDVFSPSDYGQNWLIWHPAENNALGEPAIYFVSHGDCVATRVTRAASLGFGPLLLAMMAQEILGEEALDEVYN